MPANTDLISEGDAPDDVFLVQQGIACRYKALPDGVRQIMALLLPGDFCDLHIAILGAMDHSIGAMTECRVVNIPRETIQELTTYHPRITRALWWASLVDEAILREWLVSMGRRPADRQLAHFFCEFQTRLENVGLADEAGCDFPLTQQELGDALGLSIVHVSRSLRTLRDKGLASIKHRRLRVHDRAALQAYGGFNPNYLHQRRAPAAFQGVAVETDTTSNERAGRGV